MNLNNINWVALIVTTLLAPLLGVMGFIAIILLRPGLLDDNSSIFDLAYAIGLTAVVSYHFLHALYLRLTNQDEEAELRLVKREHGQVQPKQGGFALLSVVIAVAVLILVGGGGVAVYSLPKGNEAKKETAQQELQEMQKNAEKLVQERIAEVVVDPSSAPSPNDEPTSKPVGAATTTTVSTQTIQPTGTNTDIPLIIQQEFTAVFDHGPNDAESAFWKERYRKNSSDRQRIRSWMEAHKKEHGTTMTRTSQPQQTTSDYGVTNSQQDTYAPQQYFRYVDTTDTEPITYWPSPEELEQQRRLAEEDARIAAEEYAQRVALCQAAKDSRYASAVDYAKEDASERGFGVSGILERTLRGLEADHEYRLYLCN